MVGTLKIKGKNNESRLIFVDHESRKNWVLLNNLVTKRCKAL